MSQFQRTLVAVFDATAMGVFAYFVTGGRFGADPIADLVMWGSAAAAVVAAMVVATRGAATLAWVGIGYILCAGLLVLETPQLIVTSLAFALMPIVPRPRETLALGLTIASGAALAFRAALPYVL